MVKSGSRGPSCDAGAAKRPSPIGLSASAVTPPADRRKSRRVIMRPSVNPDVDSLVSTRQHPRNNQALHEVVISRDRQPVMIRPPFVKVLPSLRGARETFFSSWFQVG